MWKPEYGNPTMTIRLPKPMIAAAKRCARLHDTNVSELIRGLLADQLEDDGINWQTIKPTPGQTSIDDYTEA